MIMFIDLWNVNFPFFFLFFVHDENVTKDKYFLENFLYLIDSDFRLSNESADSLYTVVFK